MVRILILGGTVFLGRHIVEAGLSRGHSITLFNRGRQNPELFPTVEKLCGDRNGDLSALEGIRFDAVIDTSTYTPKQAANIAEILGDSIEHYTFISSVSAYASFPPGRSYDENSPLAQGNEGYGPLKARSEETLEVAYPGQVAHVRPGLIVGPCDPTDRFTYWPQRIKRGGDVLAPGRPERPVQFIDVRDLGDWCIRLAEAKAAGRFNAVGPRQTLTMQQLLKECCSTLGSDARFHWVPDDELIAAGIEAWTELPLWIPENDEDSGGFLQGDNRKAIANGLTYRALSDTIRTTFEWFTRCGRAPDSPIRINPISSQKEAAILESRKMRTHAA
ncbi:MAG: NAD-dependent epimerase/dehydratase family protein [Elusimicrobia bacterium]|nr:NAD-dependent epimerase/dehydratase family protein [Elusimicrobiota bacterium]